MQTIQTYSAFNERRYSNPWVAIVNPKTAKIDFTDKVGGYTGGYGKGEAGELYVTEPKEGAVYAYGQKDHRGNNSETNYVKYDGGEFILVEKTKLTQALKPKANDFDSDTFQIQVIARGNFKDNGTDPERTFIIEATTLRFNYHALNAYHGWQILNTRNVYEDGEAGDKEWSDYKADKEAKRIAWEQNIKDALGITDEPKTGFCVAQSMSEVFTLVRTWEDKQ